MIAESLAHLDNVEIVSISTLFVNVARDVGADAIVKGLRAVSDFETELQMAQMNQPLSGVETLFLPTSSSYSFIASRLVREVARYGGDVAHSCPDPVAVRLKERLRWPDNEFDGYDSVASSAAPRRAAELSEILDELVGIVDARQADAAVVFGADRSRRGAGAAPRARAACPSEIREARWVLRDREELRARAARKADQLMDEVAAEAARMVERTEIVRQARRNAQQIIADAEAEARRMATRPRTTSTASSPASRSCSSGCSSTVQAGRDRLQRQRGRRRGRTSSRRWTPPRTPSSTRTPADEGAS